MPTPYDALGGLETLFYAAAVALTLLAAVGLLAAWAFLSYRKMLDWYRSIMASADRWDHFLIPPGDLVGDIFWFAVVLALNGLLLAAGLFVTGYALHLA